MSQFKLDDGGTVKPLFLPNDEVMGASGENEPLKQQRVDEDGNPIFNLSDLNPMLKLPFIIKEPEQIREPQLEQPESTEHIPGYDFFMRFEGRWDGEKNIFMEISDKSLVVVQDLLMDVVDFFKKPFAGWREASYVRIHEFNNFPSMRVRIHLNNLAVVLLDSFDKVFSMMQDAKILKRTFTSDEEKKKKDHDSLVLLSNISYFQEWTGDVGLGPGKAIQEIDAHLKKLVPLESKNIFEEGLDTRKDKFKDFLDSDNTIIQSFKITVQILYIMKTYIKQDRQPATYDLSVEFKNHRAL